ncbi:TldD/PmbA family protein [Mycoplasmatota bacterium WC44]
MLIFDIAKEKGIEDVEIYTLSSHNKSLKIFNGDVESYQISDQQVMSVRGIVDGKMGYVYTEDLNEDSHELLNRLIDNAKVVASPDIEEIFAGSESYVDLEEVISKEEITYDQIMEVMLKIDKVSKDYDNKVTDVNVSYSENSVEVVIENSKGLKLEKSDKYFMIFANVVGELDGQRSSAYEYELKKNFKEFNVEEIALGAAKATVSALGAGPCKSGTYPVILKNSVGNSMLSVLTGAFYAEGVQKGLSPLKGKLNTKIVGENITIVDDPFLKSGMNRSSFDDEGVATSVTTLVENGNLSSYLYNLKSAKKDNVESTGNGFKGGVQSKVGTSITNLYIKESNNTFEDLFEGIEKGIYITDVAGTHAGINSINGDFSLQSQGFMIENGKITTPVKLITIAGNYFEMLGKVEKIANDTKFDYSGVGTPSMLIKELPVSGK